MNKFSVLKSRDFRLLLLTRMAVMMALQSQAVIVGWQVYSLTKDLFLLGLTGLVEAVPAILCALVAGHVVDSTQPKKIFVLCVGALALNAILLLTIAGGLAEPPGGSLLLWIFIGVFFSGVARGFVSPCAFTIVSLVIPKRDMPAAAAWQSSGFQVAAVTGPAVAGLVYGGYGVTAAWVMPALLMSAAFVMANALRPPHRALGDRREPAWRSIRAGWKFIFHHQVMLSMMSLDMFAVLFGGAVAILPAFADQVLHVGSEGLGILRAAPALGAIGTALFFALRPMKKIPGARLLIVVAGFGMSMIGFALSEDFWVAMLFLILSGAFDSVSMIIRGTLMQLLTPDNMRGRLSSINSMFIISSNEIGAFESGAAAALLGLVPSIVLGGCATLGIVAVCALLAPKLRRLVLDPAEKT
jgi:MFS family permease